AGPIAAVEHVAGAAVIRLRGDLTIPTTGALYGQLHALAARPGLREVVLDFAGAGRVDSSGLAALSLAGRELEQHGVRLELASLDERQRAVLAQLARAPAGALEDEAAPQGAIERVGEWVLGAAGGAGALVDLVGETVRQTAAVA